MDQAKYFNAFNQIPQMGPARFNKLSAHFKTLSEAWRAPAAELARAGLDAPTAEIIVCKRPQIDPDAEMEKLEKFGVRLITRDSENYPRLLKEIYNPPAALYVRGKLLANLDEYAIAVVGTRKISNYGRQVTPLIVADLAKAGITIVSGLAYGVDELAHRTTLTARGRTIAVLGSGIDDASIYPASNRALALQIIESGGAVISELPLGSLPLKMHFPFRNRIIAGSTLGTLVVEADLESGSLITARLALEQNRQVFAVPGSIFNHVAAGPNNLIKIGAKAITCAADILDELNLKTAVSELEARAV
ncbi:MAG: DNA-processing protein DprA, partial [Patescibacteria group bacterium]